MENPNFSQILGCPNLALLAQQGPSIGVKFLPFLIQTFLFQVLPVGKGEGKAGNSWKNANSEFFFCLAIPKETQGWDLQINPPKKSKSGEAESHGKKKRREFQGRAGLFQVQEGENELKKGAKMTLKEPKKRP